MSQRRPASDARVIDSRRAAASGGRLVLWAMLSPFLVGSMVLVGIPLVLAIAVSVTAYDGVSPPVFTGFANMRTLAADPVVRASLEASLVVLLLAVPLRLLGALVLALLLDARRRGLGVYRAAIVLPSAIPEIAYALIWLWIVNPLYGPIDAVLAGLGLPAPGWLADPATARYPFVLMSLLLVGEGFLILLAALRGIPRDRTDAVAIDGAGTWATFRHVTLPALVPWLAVLMVRDVVVMIQLPFTAALVMTDGGPGHATRFLPLLAYEELFDRMRFGPGSLLALTMVIAPAIAAVATWLLLRRRWTDDAR